MDLFHLHEPVGMYKAHRPTQAGGKAHNGAGGALHDDIGGKSGGLTAGVDFVPQITAVLTHHLHPPQLGKGNAFAAVEGGVLAHHHENLLVGDGLPLHPLFLQREGGQGKVQSVAQKGFPDLIVGHDSIADPHLRMFAEKVLRQHE